MQRLTAELAQGRVETLLRIGQVQVATVVDVVPQPPRKGSAQPQNTTSQVRQSAENTASNTDNKTQPNNLTYTRPANSRPQGGVSTSQTGNTTQTPAQTSANSQNNNINNTAPATRATQTSSPQTSAPSTLAQQNGQAASLNASAAGQSYRARVNIEGKMLEIVTPTPLKPGTQITLSRDSQNRLIVNTPQTSNPSQTTQTVQTSGPQRLPMLQLGETSMAKVLQSRVEASPLQPPPSTPTTSSKQAASATAPPARAAVSSANTANTGQSTQNYTTTINVKGTPVEILTPRPIPAGTEVKITLDRAGQVQVQLPAPARMAADQALREHLPQQHPVNQLMNLLSDPAVSQQISRSQPLLQGILQLLLGRSLTTPQQPDSAQLRQQLQDSGTQLENRLARQDSSNLKQDTKALLLQLQSRLSNSAQTQSLPPATNQRITEMTQQAISRVLMNQLTSLSQQTQEAEGDRTRVLVTDIPVLWQQRTENLQLRISQRQGSSEEERENPALAKWQVQLRFDMEGIPPMQANISMQAEDISVLFYGNEEIKALVEPHLDSLKASLEDVGLQVDMLQVRDSLPQDAPVTRSHSPLVDIHT